MIPVGYVENVGERLDDLFIFLGKKAELMCGPRPEFQSCNE
jgi:hypothetical protein